MNDTPTRREPLRVSRRDLLIGGGGLGLGLLGGAVAGAAVAAAAPSTAGTATPAATAGTVVVPSRGAQQAGIDRPGTPQHNTLVAVADLPGVATGADALAVLAVIGERVDACTDPERFDPDILPDGPGDLTVTIGIGPRVVTAIDPSLPGATGLPAFVGDADVADDLHGGDLFVSVSSSDAGAVRGVAEAVLTAAGAARRWSQHGVRGAGQGTVVRNPLGYHDGIVVPRTPAELATNVWIETGPAAGGTIAVVRRLRLDIDGFRAQPAAEQDRVVGRRRADGAPLSGGTRDDEVDLMAKTPEGEYLIATRSHVRAAHPSFTGTALMLRRGYGYSNASAPGSPPDDGLLFVCFQRELDVFVRTQQRLDETDDLMTYATTTASGSFLVLPGRGEGALGAGLAG